MPEKFPYLEHLPPAEPPEFDSEGEGPIESAHSDAEEGVKIIRQHRETKARPKQEHKLHQPRMANQLDDEPSPPPKTESVNRRAVDYDPAPKKVNKRQDAIKRLRRPVRSAYGKKKPKLDIYTQQNQAELNEAQIDE